VSVLLKVELIKHTEDAESCVASAAKLCYAEDATTIFNDEDDSLFIKRLKDMGHLSPFEHASYTFYVEGISRVTSHQLVRHRLASYSQRSQRYVAHDNFEYVIPPSLVGMKVQLDDSEIVDAVEYYNQCMKEVAIMYNNLNNALGACGEESNQDARYILPNACETKIFMTMNARELMHFLEERLCLRAQWEIRGLADEILNNLQKVSPNIFENVGPKCIKLNGCPEGKMSCGEFKQIKEKYGN